MTAGRTRPAPGFVPSVSAGVARAWVDLAGRLGVDTGALLSRAGLDRQALQDQDQRVPFEKLQALVRAAKAMSGEPGLGLRFGETVDCADYSVVSMMSRACATVADAIAQRNRYGRLLAEFGDEGEDLLQLRPCGADVWLVCSRRERNTMSELIEAFLARVAWGTRQLGAASMLKAAHFTHPEPPYRAEYERVFQVPLVFGSDKNALLLDAAWPQIRVALAPAYVFGILSAHAEALLHRLDEAQTLRGRVERLLMPVLHTGEAGIVKVAGQLGTSRQTLYRRLKAEGASFERVLDELRRRLALSYLGGGKVSVNETAYLVGFSDAAAFSRAFKRWTGQRPSNWRQAPPAEPGQEPGPAP